MAEKETKEVKEVSAKEAPQKAKVKKPTLFSRLSAGFAKLAAWLKTCKAEMKKIVWANWDNVKSNTIMVLICIVVVSAIIGVLDLLFSQGIVVLSILL